jgi:hypothetical protein
MRLTQGILGTNGYESGIWNSVTLFGLLKLILMKLHLTSIPPSTLLIYFELFTLCCGVFLFIYLQKYETELWKIVLILISCTLLFNYTSHIYRMISLLIPMWLFINKKQSSKNYIVYCLLFELLLIPMRYDLRVSGVHFDLSTASSPILMMIFVFLIIKERFDLIRTNLKSNIKEIA